MKRKRRAETSPKRRPERRWSRITWADLDDWAGSRAVSRGRAYHRSGAVHDLAISTEGELLAWVVGGSRYATRVRLDSPRSRGRGAIRLESSCSCPVGIGCKHAVATVVAALDEIEAGEPLAPARTDDARLELAAGGPTVAVPETTSNPSDLEPYLRSLEKSELVEILLHQSALHPEIEADLLHRRVLSGGDVPAIVKRLREEIAIASAQDAWSDGWNGEDNLPDYSRVQDGLEQLFAREQADAVIELGRELFEAGTEQVDRSHDEGETSMAIADCLSVVFRALLRSSLPDPEKVLYAIDMSLADGYGLADGAERIVDRRWSKRTWSAVADALAPRLEAGRSSTGRDFHSRYYRKRLSDRLVFALDASGRESEATALCESEAPLTHAYDRLVRRLIDGKQLDEAREQAERGHAALVDEHPGSAAGLRELLVEIARRRRQWDLVAAYSADAFFERPDVARFEELLAAAAKADVEAAVRKSALRFLETGRRPARSGKWPLPSTRLRPAGGHGDGRRSTKHWDVLRDLAIAEDRPDDVLRWHDKLAPQAGSRFGPSENAELAVARAVASTHPQRAIEIYRAEAERQIARVNPDAYAQAGGLLRNVRDLLDASDRSSEWAEMLAGLREAHGRKRRLMEVLDGLEGRPIARRRTRTRSRATRRSTRPR